MPQSRQSAAFTEGAVENEMRPGLSHDPRLHVGSNLLYNSIAWGTFTELSRIELSRIELSGIEQCRHSLYGIAFYHESTRKFYLHCQEFWGVS